MQAILISSKDFEKGRQEAERIFLDLKIDKFDRSIFEFEKAIGIADVRELQKKIYLKPIKSQVKAILIDATPGITPEAQNALLKTLEESPEDTIIILQVANADEILSTIISRCKVIEIKGKKENADVSKHFEIITGEGIGDKLKLAQDLSKDKNATLELIENLISASRENMIKGNYQMAGQIKTLQKYYTIIKTTNTNLRLALENLFLNL